MKRLLLFDIDGTLLITKGATSRCIHRACRSIFGESFQWGGVTVGTLDPQIFAQLAAYNRIADADQHEARYREVYLADLASELDRVRADVTVLPGVMALLERLRQRNDVTCGLLTGNYEKAARLKLAAGRIDASQFQVNAFAEAAEDRPGLVRSAIAEYGRRFGEAISGESVIVIGDTPNDVACAKANGCVAFTVSTGHFGAAALVAAGADWVVPDLSDPTPLLELLDRQERARTVR